MATAMHAAGAAGPAFAADRGGPVDFGNDGPVDFGENDGESALFAGPGCEPPNRLIATWEPDRYVWVWGPQHNLARGYWEGCGREK